MSASRSRSNGRVALGLAGLVATMGAMSFAAVPLYRWFCQVTGFGGTTMRAERAPDQIGDMKIVVRFNADIGGTDLPWRFESLERKVELRVGEERLTHYRATNIGTVPVVGTATYNVTPHKAAPYFHKLACFCFTEQELAPGESLDMPVSFFVDPAIASDPKMRGVETITLSYTFFRALDAKPQTGTGRTAASGSVPVPVN